MKVWSKVWVVVCLSCLGCERAEPGASPPVAPEVEERAVKPKPAEEGGAREMVLPVTEDGTGTVCQTDADCPKEGATMCLKPPKREGGFCTREGCAPGSCQGAYVCCHSCSAMAASMLPFKESVCAPEVAADRLTGFPVSCTCD